VTPVVITDSVGYEIGMSMIFEELGVELPPITVQYLVCRNGRRKYSKVYNKCLDLIDCQYSEKKQKIQYDLVQKAMDAAAKGGRMNYSPSVDVEDIIEAIRVESPTVDVNGQNITTVITMAPA